MLLYRYAAHAVDNCSVPWLRTAYAGGLPWPKLAQPYGPFLAPDGYKSATNRRSATPSSLYCVICPGTPPLCFGEPGYYQICVLRTPLRDIERHAWGLCGCGCLMTRMPGALIYDAPRFRLEPDIPLRRLLGQPFDFLSQPLRVEDFRVRPETEDCVAKLIFGAQTQFIVRISPGA